MQFDGVRREFELPDAFPAEVEREAAEATDRFAADRRDARDIPFVTIDPPGSRDLDQAVHLERTSDGFLLHYAIADVGAFVVPDSALDLEARRRGQTVYVPDGSVPLHPRSLSEGAASLLPEQDRPCALWTIETDEHGVVRRRTVERAVVRSRAQLEYEHVQRAFDEGSEVPAAIAALPAFGAARQRLAIERGAVELRLPAQDLTNDGSGWQLRLEPRTVVDAWNAECSLVTGQAAASIMIEARIGILRTLPAADAKADAAFRAAAAALGLSWPPNVSPGAFLASLDDADVRTLALMSAATKLLRGSGYLAFDARDVRDDDGPTGSQGIPADAPDTPANPPHGAADEPGSTTNGSGSAANGSGSATNGSGSATNGSGSATNGSGSAASRRFHTLPDPTARWHAGVATEYAHATAPLRRLADRYAIELCLAAQAHIEPEPGLVAALPEIPARMTESSRLANAVEAACLDEAEAVVLAPHVGDVFDAAVLRPATEKHDAEIFVLDPPVIAACGGEPASGSRVRARLVTADASTRTVRFEAVTD
nr:RNB domain-containing ribonuclease [Pseudoclavibacter chungangensis]